MNWRKPVILALLYLSGSNIPRYLKHIKKLERLSPEMLRKYQEDKLRRILIHSYMNIPYYSDVLEQSGVVVDGKVNLDNFGKISVLTKDKIREQGSDLVSKDYKNRKYYKNTSGGSTGEPVTLVQDRQYSEWNIANKIYYKWLGGQDIGEREYRLWGSERDLLEGGEGILNKMRNWLYNRTDLNSFRMSLSDMQRFVFMINKGRPTWIEAYAQSAYELAKYAKEKGIRIHSPRGILTSAGVLYPYMKQLIQEVFKCNIFNRYGSREVGDMACNCPDEDALHLSLWNHYIEVDKISDSKGRIYVTTLNNYSMPLIRYEIGDIAMLPLKNCGCSRSTPTIAGVTGRTVNLFTKKDGTLVDGEYFTHLFYFKDWIKKFQVIQKQHDMIICNIVPRMHKNQRDVADIEEKIKIVMGEDCAVKFVFTNEISPSKSGKHLYTISEVC